MKNHLVLLISSFIFSQQQSRKKIFEQFLEEERLSINNNCPYVLRFCGVNESSLFHKKFIWFSCIVAFLIVLEIFN